MSGTRSGVTSVSTLVIVLLAFSDFFCLAVGSRIVRSRGTARERSPGELAGWDGSSLDIKDCLTIVRGRLDMGTGLDDATIVELKKRQLELENLLFEKVKHLRYRLRMIDRSLNSSAFRESDRQTLLTKREAILAELLKVQSL
mmetsp:Transcript_4890/g.9882  ORF Transcript_4890/g.9882 Transcript_4890/m.9882 type:complete len:143 (-) Transcript_4890:539-967(-)